MKVEARSIGPIASQVLRRHSDATVIASFDHSFYLDADGHLICVASESLYDGPFNILTRLPGHGAAWPSLPIAVGQRWTIDDNALSCADDPGIDIDLSAALAWCPKPPPRDLPNPSQIGLAVGNLRALAASRCRRDGLLDLVLDQESKPNSAAARAAQKPLQDLSQHAMTWLGHGDRRIMASLEALLGLGPGLTPSGDDLIAGLLIGCRYIGRDAGALDLWRTLEREAKTRTTPISMAHLSAAGQGMGAAPFHDLIDALIENRTVHITEALDAVARIGHSSGLDAVGGLLILLDAWIAVGNAQAAPAA
ncbi:MAG: DUF2877 domain-containing protein [Geminicoccaceae bacterium]